MKSILVAVLILSAAFVPASALAQTPGFGVVQQNTGGTFGVFFSGSGGFGLCTSSICGVAQTILYLINNVLVPLLFAVAFIVFLYGVFKKYIWSHGDASSVEEGHKLIFWGIIGFVVMISLWGLVNVVSNTFGLYGAPAPMLPRSY